MLKCKMWHFFKVSVILLYFSANLLATVAGRKYNITLAEMSTCKEHDLIDTGYTYQQFFRIRNLDNNKLANDERLHLKFYVVTPMDAHILLSVTDRPRLLDRVYEIVIGAGGNTFSAIRTNMGRRRIATNQDPKLLSLFDPTPIEVIQKKDGNLAVFIPGFKEEPIMNYTDPSPLTINYISFSTFGMVSARWFYDCQFDGFESEMEKEVHPLTPEQRLIVNITVKGQNKMMPRDLQSVNFAFQIRSVAFDQDASVLKTRMHLMLYWNDPVLQWNPEDFNGIDSVSRPFLDIWTPKIVLLNGALKTFRNFKPSHELKVTSNGSVVLLATNAEINTWCLNNKRNWPQDNIDCEVDLGLQEQRALTDDLVYLAYDASAPLSHENFNTLSEWNFVKTIISPITNGIMARYTDSGIMRTMVGDVSIGFSLKRNSTFYKNVFTMPILACQTLTLLGFVLRGYRRGAVLLVVVVILCLGLMFITKHAPPSYVPDIMVAYQHGLRVVTFCYILHVVIMWLELFPPKDKPCNCMMSIINSSPLRMLLCMRFEDSAEYVAIQEFPWREIAKIINNLSFIIITIIFIVVDVMLLPKD